MEPNNQPKCLPRSEKQLRKTAISLLAVGIVNCLVVLSCFCGLLQTIVLPSPAAGAAGFLIIYQLMFCLALGIVLTFLSINNFREARKVRALDNGSSYKSCRRSFILNLLTVVSLLLFFIGGMIYVIINYLKR